MDLLRDVADEWLALRGQSRVGVDDTGLSSIVSIMQRLASGQDVADGHWDELGAAADARPLGLSLTDALWESAALIGEAAQAVGLRRTELLSSARGWLLVGRTASGG